jgi:hypothetical protein
MAFFAPIALATPDRSILFVVRMKEMVSLTADHFLLRFRHLGPK